MLHTGDATENAEEEKWYPIVDVKKAGGGIGSSGGGGGGERSESTPPSALRRASSASRLSFRRASSSGKLSLPADGDTGVELTGEVLLRLGGAPLPGLDRQSRRATRQPPQHVPRRR